MRKAIFLGRETLELETLDARGIRRELGRKHFGGSEAAELGVAIGPTTASEGKSVGARSFLTFGAWRQ